MVSIPVVKSPVALRSPRSLPEGYTLVVGSPPLDSYVHLRQASGLSPKTLAQAERALVGSWYMIYIIYMTPQNATSNIGEITTPPSGSIDFKQDKQEQSQVVGMARTIGDGGWYFHIVDVAVLPEHQRKGLGDVLMGMTLKYILEQAPENPYITLLADPPGIKLYQRWGFKESAPESRGMDWDAGSLALKS